jgi:hypothetical protein
MRWCLIALTRDSLMGKGIADSHAFSSSGAEKALAKPVVQLSREARPSGDHERAHGWRAW